MNNYLDIDELNTKRGSLQKGVGVLEALISIMVLTTAISAVVIIVFGNQSLKLDNEVNNSALYNASRIIEKSRILSANNFNSVIASTSIDDIFKQNLQVTDISPCRKDITSLINWSVQANRPQNINLTTSLVSAKEADNMGNDCIANTPETAWRNPQTYNGSDLFPGGNAGTDIDVFLVDGSKYAALTSIHSASTSDDFWIYDVTNLKKTDVMAPYSRLNTGYGLYAVDVAKNDITGRFFAYAVGEPGPQDPEQLKIIDLADRRNPVIVAEVLLPGAGNLPGREVYFYKDRIYVGVPGGGFYIYDVSNPYNPVYKGGIQIGQSPRDIIVRDELINGMPKTIAYLALSVATNTNPEMIILDVTDPATISIRGSYNAPGTQNGTALYILGDKLYLGRAYGPSNELFLLNIADHNSIGVLGSARLDLSPSVAEVTSILVSKDLLFVGSGDSNQEFQVWNVANPANIFWWSQFNFPAGVTGMEFDGKYMYISVNSNDGFRILYDAP